MSQLFSGKDTVAKKTALYLATGGSNGSVAKKMTEQVSLRFNGYPR